MITLNADAKVCSIIKAYLQLNALADLCTFQEVQNSKYLILCHENQEKTYSVPLRLGEIIDQLNKYKNNPSSESIYINFKNGCSLDLPHGIFTNSSNEQISLTEKEVEILSFLNENKGSIVPRDKLLHAVWSYAKNVETHTLETHIYRLRQKIELDPANPEILITEEKGYRASVI